MFELRIEIALLQILGWELYQSTLENGSVRLQLKNRITGNRYTGATINADYVTTGAIVSKSKRLWEMLIAKYEGFYTDYALMMNVIGKLDIEDFIIRKKSVQLIISGDKTILVDGTGVDALYLALTKYVEYKSVQELYSFVAGEKV